MTDTNQTSTPDPDSQPRPAHDPTPDQDSQPRPAHDPTPDQDSQPHTDQPPVRLPDQDLQRALALPDVWAAERDAVLAVDRATAQPAASGVLEDEAPVLALREHIVRHMHQMWLPVLPNLWMWPPGWYIPRDTDWRVFGPQYFAPPDSRRYSLAWTTGTSPVSAASAGDGTASAYVASRPDEDYRKVESGVGITYSPGFGLGTVRVVPEIACSGILRTRLEMYPQRVAGSVRVSASVVVAQWQVIPGGYDLARYYTVPIATTSWVDQSHGARWDTFSKAPPASAFTQPFLVERGKTYLFGVIARIETWSNLRDANTGRPIVRFEGNSFNLWGDHDTVTRRIKVLTVQRYM